MALAKRIALFLIVNILVVTVISFILYLFNFQPFLNKYGLNYASLAIFCLVWGMGGAFISLALSRIMAKWLMSVKVIDPKTTNPELRGVLEMVYRLAQKAGLPTMPEVGIYRSAEVNAFATGPTKSRALVAISSGLLQRMNDGEIEGVIGHEITHIANGDMVTMTLLQGVINAFVMFFARVFAFALSRVLSRSRDDSSEGFSPLMYQLTVFAFEMVFMILGSLVIARFSRFREFRADAGGARLAGPQNMISALNALKRTQERMKAEPQGQPALQALKISSQSGWLSLFATHPPLDDRIARLQCKFKA
jgi:heat shock protein HtpX